MMGFIMKTFTIFILSFTFSVGQALGCTLAGKTISQFDASEYVFIGTVTGYTKSVGFDANKPSKATQPIDSTRLAENEKRSSGVTGLIVRVREFVYLPKPGVEFEVFQYDLRADCALVGMSLSALETAFPINSEVRVIAKEAVFLTEPANDRIRLEDRPSEQGQVIANSDKGADPLSLMKSVFDYKGYRYDRDVDSYSKYLLPAFEIRKDLLGLKRASTQAERNSILERILYAPRDADVDFYQLFKLYATNAIESRRYYESRLSMVDPEGLEMYQIYQNVVEDLIKLGHSRTASEAAIDQALKAGTELISKPLLKKSLKILVTNKKSL
jgi:hypothetical protein